MRNSEQITNSDALQYSSVLSLCCVFNASLIVTCFPTCFVARGWRKKAAALLVHDVAGPQSTEHGAQLVGTSQNRERATCRPDDRQDSRSGCGSLQCRDRTHWMLYCYRHCDGTGTTRACGWYPPNRLPNANWQVTTTNCSISMTSWIFRNRHFILLSSEVVWSKRTNSTSSFTKHSLCTNETCQTKSDVTPATPTSNLWRQHAFELCHSSNLKRSRRFQRLLLTWNWLPPFRAKQKYRFITNQVLQNRTDSYKIMQHHTDPLRFWQIPKESYILARIVFSAKLYVAWL